MQNTASTAITPFLFGESTIRTITIRNTPYFLAKDVCDCLGIANHRDAVARLEPCERGVGNTDTLGGTQEMTYVNESGLYALIFKSRKKEAIQFRLWVTSEVLPAIRKSGAYSRGHRAFLSLIEDQLALGVSPDLAARLAGRITGTPAPDLQGYQPTEQVADDIDALVQLMEPGESYSIPALRALLPVRHPLAVGTAAAASARIGKLLEKARRLQRVEKLPGRTVTYRLPAIAAFPAAGTP